MKLEQTKSQLGYTCIVFPGRDAVQKGFNPSFYNKDSCVKKIFEEASDFLHISLNQICYSGQPIDDKWQTLCLVVHCYSMYQVVKKYFETPKAVAGYSQGEFTACMCSGAFQFPEILGLIQYLEEVLLEERIYNTCMKRIVGIPVERLEQICHYVDASGDNVAISSYISEEQNIISGKESYVEQVVIQAKEEGARWAIPLSNQTFHCKLYCDIAKKVRPSFQKMPLGEAVVPVYSCYDGESSMDSYAIRDKVSKQLDHAIQWRKIIANLTDNKIFTMLELGPGCTTSGNSRLADGRMHCSWVESVDDLQDAMANINSFCDI